MWSAARQAQYPSNQAVTCAITPDNHYFKFSAITFPSIYNYFFVLSGCYVAKSFFIDRDHRFASNNKDTLYHLFMSRLRRA